MGSAVIIKPITDELEKIKGQLLSGNITQDLTVAMPTTVDCTNVFMLKTNNHDLTLTNNFSMMSIANSNSINLGTGNLSMPDLTGSGIGNYFLRNVTAKKVYMPEVTNLTNGSVMLGGKVDYWYLPKLEKINDNQDLVCRNTNKTWWLPALIQIGKTGIGTLFYNSNVQNLIIGTPNCTLNKSVNLNVLQNNNGNVFVPHYCVSNYKTADVWSEKADLILGYDETTVPIGGTVTLSGGDRYELVKLWFEDNEDTATLSGNVVTFNNSGDVFVRICDATGKCLSGYLYHIA